MPQAKQSVYFMFNQFTGLIKIGISNDVEYRRKNLEYASGVALTVLRVIDGAGAALEEQLHLAFSADRQIGEWFLPSESLLAIIEDESMLEGFLQSAKQRIATARAAEIHAADVRQAERKAALAAEREAVRVAAEAKRQAEAALRAKREARKAREVEKRRLAAEEAAAAQAAQLNATRGRTLQWFEDRGLIPPGATEMELDRLARIKKVRERNLKMLGVAK